MSHQPGPARHAYGTAGADGYLRVVSVNTQHGGTDKDGSTRRMARIAAAVRQREPHVVLAQELRGTAREASRHKHAWAHALRMETAALGPPRGTWEQRCGIFTDRALMQVVEDGPAPVRDAPGWAEAVLLVKPAHAELYVVSDHAPATDPVVQLSEAARQASRAARRLSVIGGDRNNYSRHDQLSEADLVLVRNTMPHVAPARLRRDADGRLVGNYDVEDTLARAGLTDPVSFLTRDRRFPPDPPGTGAGPGRIDRYSVSEPVRDAVACCHQFPVEGTNHEVIMLCLALEALARIAAARIRP